ncbi:hypothetical protein [Desulfosporosinus sp. Sb-LF]|uniref:hypothetical protein n=1 Tax=Desulfosporosinus sp. Sb-LF TaxID=2560027 RepID=UPI00107FA603|nr:hypothetical protein [Desulfosporosinus sp. Sb-LF]TGE31032.1 hypothetical protein E4K68_19480 [Desulfosporosinus sp. Sb-LF]
MRHVHDRRPQDKQITLARAPDGAEHEGVFRSMRRPCRVVSGTRHCVPLRPPRRFREVWRSARFSRSLGLMHVFPEWSVGYSRKLGLSWMLSLLGIFRLRLRLEMAGRTNAQAPASGGVRFREVWRMLA